MKDIFIVGAGLYGCVLAERISSVLKKNVTIIEKREHIGGNCWSEIDKYTNIEYHKYGSHIFHTSNKYLFEYISNFIKLNNYKHHVFTEHNNKIYTLPINLKTINDFYNKNMKPAQAKRFIQQEARKENIYNPENFEEKAISLIGRKLYEAFIYGYTVKQWEKDPIELNAEIISRLPVRYDYNNRYFEDIYEGVPCEGYCELFKRLLDNKRIKIELNTDFLSIKDKIIKNSYIIYSGPIDAFFEYRLGNLEWRTVDFNIERYDMEDYQGTSVINYANKDIPYTRTHEFRHFHPERKYSDKTIVFREYSRLAKETDEPYYPISSKNNMLLFRKYKELSKKYKNIIFGGRLGSYRYFDMDDTIYSAIKTFNKNFL